MAYLRRCSIVAQSSPLLVLLAFLRTLFLHFFDALVSVLTIRFHLYRFVSTLAPEPLHSHPGL